MTRTVRPRPSTASSATPSPAAEVATVLAWLERRGTRKNRDGLARYGITVDQGVRRLDDDDADAGPAAWAATMRWPGPSGTAAGTRRARWSPSSPIRRRRPPPRWTAGAATSTTGRSATRCASTCSTRRRMPGRKVGRVGAPAARVREARRVRAAGGAGAARQGGAGQPVPHQLRAHRAGGHRRAELREEGRQLGAAAIGHRNLSLHTAASDLATRLARSDDATARWVGKDTLRDLQRPAVVRKLDARARRAR